MQILKYGVVVQCRKIIFDDNKFDVKNSHPGIVLLPTNENAEKAYCLYMTSDKLRARNQNDKYIKFKGVSLKPSFINLKKIVIRNNHMDKEFGCLSDSEFFELLKAFYDYQMNLEPKEIEFLEIKNKISVLLTLLQIKIACKIRKNDITIETIESLENINDSKKIKNLYLLSQGIKPDYSTPREQNYYQKLNELCDELSRCNLKYIDFSNLNNQLRNIYMKYKEKYYLIDVDLLFKDAAIIFSIQGKRKNEVQNIETLIDIEQKRIAEKAKKKSEKSVSRELNKKISNSQKTKNTEQLNNIQEKYGNFPEF